MDELRNERQAHAAILAGLRAHNTELDKLYRVLGPDCHELERKRRRLKMLERAKRQRLEERQSLKQRLKHWFRGY